MEKHSQIAMTLLPLSVAGGFAYTANVGTNPLDDLKAAVLGAPRPFCIPLLYTCLAETAAAACSHQYPSAAIY